MKYNLKNKIDIQSFKFKSNVLIGNESFVELKRIAEKRTNPQNRYFHLLVSWFAIEYGETKQYVKQIIIKQKIYPELFKTTYTNKKTGVKRVEWKSTADINEREMSITINKFRKYASDGGIYLPEANENEFLKHIEIEIEKYKTYI